MKNNLLINASSQQEIKFYNLETLKKRRTINALFGDILQMEVSPKENYFAISYQNSQINTLLIIELKKLVVVRKLVLPKTNHQGIYYAVVSTHFFFFSRDLFAYNNEKAVHIWSLKRMKKILSIRTKINSRKMSSSYKDKYLFIHDDTSYSQLTFIVYNWRKKETIRRFVILETNNVQIYPLGLEKAMFINHAQTYPYSQNSHISITVFNIFDTFANSKGDTELNDVSVMKFHPEFGLIVGKKSGLIEMYSLELLKGLNSKD